MRQFSSVRLARPSAAVAPPGGGEAVWDIATTSWPPEYFTLSDGDKGVIGLSTTNGGPAQYSTIRSKGSRNAGKHLVEFLVTDVPFAGVTYAALGIALDTAPRDCNPAGPIHTMTDSVHYEFRLTGTLWRDDVEQSPTVAQAVSGDRIQLLMDFDASTCAFRKNGVALGTVTDIASVGAGPWYLIYATREGAPKAEIMEPTITVPGFDPWF